MDLQKVYSKIDELFSEYIKTEESYKDTIKSKLLKIICDVINSDFNYKSYIENGDFDYLPVLMATNDAIKYFPSSKNNCFHAYLFACIKKAIKKDMAQNKHSGFSLNYSNINEIKKIKKLLDLYNGNKRKVADALEISLKKLNALLASESIVSFSKRIGYEDSATELGDTIPSSYDLLASKIVLDAELDSRFGVFDAAWKDEKPLHQNIISDWLTSQTLSELENAKFVSLMENDEEAFDFLFKYSFINREIVRAFFADPNFELLTSYASASEKYGMTRSAVCKIINKFYKKLKNSVNI